MKTRQTWRHPLVALAILASAVGAATAQPPAESKHRGFNPKVRWLPDDKGLWFGVPFASPKRFVLVESSPRDRL